MSLDTLRADRLGTYGYSRPTTPFLDEFSRSAVVFEKAIAQAPFTRPSHNSLFQSRLASRVSPESATLAEALRDAGYETAGFTDGGYVSSKFGFDRGFAIYHEGRQGLSESVPKVDEWLRARNDSLPFFLFLHTYDVHLPYSSPREYRELFVDPDYSGPVNPKTTRTLAQQFKRQIKEGEDPIVLTEADKKHFNDLYDAGVRYLDDQLRDFVEVLEENADMSRTIVVLTSDHGEELWDHGSISHGHELFQELVHVPLIVRFPRERFAGTRVQAVVPLMDLSPGLLELLRVPIPDSFEGSSIVPLISGVSAEHRVAFSEMARASTIIDFPWKLTVHRKEYPEGRLFNLEDDPLELSPLTGLPEVRERLERQLRDLGVSRVPDAADPGSVPKELADRLRALGYIQ